MKQSNVTCEVDIKSAIVWKKYVSVILFTMRKRKLSEPEKSEIDAYLECGKSVPEISKLIKQSVGVIYNLRKYHANYGKNLKKK